MRARHMLIGALLAVGAYVTVTTSAFAAAGSAAGDALGNVGQHRLQFEARGNTNNASGSVTFTEGETGYFFTANVTCYYQEKGPAGSKRAVFTGPITSQAPRHFPKVKPSS